MAHRAPSVRPTRPAFDDRDRYYGEAALTAAPFFRGLLVAAFAISVGLLVAALSARQVSQRDSALPVLAASIEALTDPHRLVESQHVALRALAEESPEDLIIVPGYPVDVGLSAEEVRTLDARELADLLTDRAAVVVYAEGMEALDQTGNQGDGLFSAQGVVRRVSDRLTDDTHEFATSATVGLLLVVAGLGVAVVLAYRDERRLRALGIGVLIGGLGGVALSLLAGLVASQAGGADPFEEDVRDIVATVIEVPRRNYVVVSLLGVAITGVSLVLQFLRRRDAGRLVTAERFDEA